MTTLWMSLLVLAIGIAIGVIFTVIQTNRREHLDTRSHYNPSEKSSEKDDDILSVRKVSPSDSRPTSTVNIKAPVNPPPPTPKTQPKAAPTKTSIKIINVMAKSPHHFRGYELLQTLLSAGLRYGDMKIFHRHQHPNGKGPILFSLASVTEPGTFDIQKIGEFNSPGVTLFMQTSESSFDDERYQLMLATAEQLAEELEGVVFDQSFAPISQESYDEVT